MKARSVEQSKKTIKPVGRSLCFSSVVSLCLMLGSTFSEAAMIKNLQFSSLPGDQIELTLSFDGPPPEPKSYSIEQPARIALDLPKATSGLPQKYYNLGLGNARGVNIMQAQDRARLIINLVQLVSFETRREGNNLIVTIGKGAEERLISTDTSSAKDSIAGVGQKSLQAKKVESKSLSEVDFRRGTDGEGQVVLTLTDPNIVADVHEESGKIVIDLVGVYLPEDLRRRLDVVDFSTPVKSIDVLSEQGRTRILIKSEGNYEYLAFQADNNFTVSVKPVTDEELEKRKKDKFIFTGEKLTLNFQDIEVRSVLQLIADFTSLNLVASDTVGGNITLRLQNVPWDQALDLILKTKGLDKRKIGNVMLVAPADEIAAREKLELESSKQTQDLAPTHTEFVQINYAKGSDLAKLITGGGEEGGGSGLLTSRGTVSVDERTNTLILQDTSAKIEEIRRLLNKLDVPVQQVLIEARVVIANSDFNKELGIRWGGGKRHRNGTSSYLADDGTVTTLPFHDIALSGSGSEVLGAWDTNDGDPSYSITRPDDLVVDLGVSNSQATSFALGFFNRTGDLLELELSAVEADGQADIIATPKVLTADQQPARIASGTEIPYQEASSSGASTTSFKEAVLSLDVTPHITPDGRVIMELKVNQDSVGKVYNNVPSIDTNKIETRVLVNDGETVVLGGVFRNNTVSSVAKTPFFGDLPIVGALFRHTQRSDEKQELLVFITPKLVKGSLAQQ